MLRTNGLMISISCPLLTGKIPPIPLIALKQFLFCIVIGTNPITRKRKHILIGFVLHPVGREQHSSEVSTKLMLMAGGHSLGTLLRPLFSPIFFCPILPSFFSFSAKSVVDEFNVIKQSLS